jgi:hypothetical protein
MANAAAHKTIGATFSGSPEWVKLTYDFAEDTGAVANYELATFASKCLVLEALVHVETLCTSGGSATVAIGINDTDADAFMTTTTGAVANLADDFVSKISTTDWGVAQEDDTIRLAIATAALTAGKINVWVQYVTVL